MSNLWAAAQVADAAAQPVWARPAEGGSFTPWALDRGRIEAELAEIMPAPPSQPIDVTGIEAAAYEAGLDAGRAEAAEIVASERQALARLAAGLEALRPEPTGALAALLAETVDRLVRQIVGEVEIDRDILIARAEAAAALIGEETGPSMLRFNPADLARIADVALPVPVGADPRLAPGTLRLETASGWIEDGPEVRLERLRNALDAMGSGR